MWLCYAIVMLYLFLLMVNVTSVWSVGWLPLVGNAAVFSSADARQLSHLVNLARLYTRLSGGDAEVVCEAGSIAVAHGNGDVSSKLVVSPCAWVGQGAGVRFVDGVMLFNSGHFDLADGLSSVVISPVGRVRIDQRS